MNNRRLCPEGHVVEDDGFPCIVCEEIETEVSNQADEAAFEEWWENEGLSPDEVDYCKDLWLAACAYARTDERKRCESQLAEANAGLARLSNQLAEALSIRGNDGLD